MWMMCLCLLANSSHVYHILYYSLVSHILYHLVCHVDNCYDAAWDCRELMGEEEANAAGSVDHGHMEAVVDAEDTVHHRVKDNTAIVDNRNEEDRLNSGKNDNDHDHDCHCDSCFYVCIDPCFCSCFYSFSFYSYFHFYFYSYYSFVSSSSLLCYYYDFYDDYDDGDYDCEREYEGSGEYALHWMYY